MKAVSVCLLTFATLFGLQKWKLLRSDNASRVNRVVNITHPPQSYAAVFPKAEHDGDDNHSSRTLNVHVVAHTHDDVGWLKTVEQYFYGQNQSIQHVCVDDILTTVVEALMENPYRTFTYVEQKFFRMWWDRQSDTIKDSVRDLVKRKQLTFVNGGYVEFIRSHSLTIPESLMCVCYNCFLAGACTMKQLHIIWG
jgi:hypothetical protein